MQYARPSSACLGTTFADSIFLSNSFRTYKTLLSSGNSLAPPLAPSTRKIGLTGFPRAQNRSHMVGEQIAKRKTSLKEKWRNYVIRAPMACLLRAGFYIVGTCPGVMKNANGQYAANGRPISNQSPRLLNLNSPTANSTSQQIARNRHVGRWVHSCVKKRRTEKKG